MILSPERASFDRVTELVWLGSRINTFDDYRRLRAAGHPRLRRHEAGGRRPVGVRGVPLAADARPRAAEPGEPAPRARVPARVRGGAAAGVRRVPRRGRAVLDARPRAPPRRPFPDGAGRRRARLPRLARGPSRGRTPSRSRRPASPLSRCATRARGRPPPSAGARRTFADQRGTTPASTPLPLAKDAPRTNEQTAGRMRAPALHREPAGTRERGGPHGESRRQRQRAGSHPRARPRQELPPWRRGDPRPPGPESGRGRGRVHRVHGSERFGQDDAAEPPGRPGRSDATAR